MASITPVTVQDQKGQTGFLELLLCKLCRTKRMFTSPMSKPHSTVCSCLFRMTDAAF
jgi:hypothetical protein